MAPKKHGVAATTAPAPFVPLDDGEQAPPTEEELAEETKAQQFAEGIRFVARRYRNQIEGCYERAFKQEPSSPGGRVDVAFTVDKNPYKQGRFLPGTHIPIHAPEKIDQEKPDFILILPWNFKDEILKQLAQENSFSDEADAGLFRGDLFKADLITDLVAEPAAPFKRDATGEQACSEPARLQDDDLSRA